MTTDSLFFRFTFYVLPWIMYCVFALGVFIQVRKWLSGAPSPVKKENAGFAGTVKNLFLNLVLQKRLLKKKPASMILWVSVWLLFHVPLFFIFIGHLRAFGVWSADWFTWLASKEFLTQTLPLYMGFVLLSGAVLLLLRRVIFTAPRSISTTGNYTILVLIILAIVSGDVMRTLHQSAGGFSVTVPPGFILELEHIPSLTWFSLHVFIAQITIMLIPFSGLIHIIGSGVTIPVRARGK